MKRINWLRKPLIIILALTLIAALTGTGIVAMAAGEPAATGAAAQTAGYDVTKNGAGRGGDDTQAIQSALDRYDSVYIPDGVYYINADISLRLRSNQTLTLSDGATLQALPSANDGYSIIMISGVSNTVVTGGRIVGDREVHRGSTGEYGMGVFVNGGASNITVSNMTISGCWGDGVYLGEGTSPVTDILVKNVICDGNRRQGLSITNGFRVTIDGCTFKNTHGTAPQAGIDIEPWADYQTSDVKIINTTCTGNAGSGLDIWGDKYIIYNIDVSGSVFSNNGGCGIRAVRASGLTFSDSFITGNLYGIEFPKDVTNAKCSGLTISGNMSRGVSLVTTSQVEGTSDIVFESSTFSNNSQKWSAPSDGIRIDRWDATGYIRNVTFKSCLFIDDQTVKTQGYGLSVGLGNGMSGIVVEPSCKFSGNIYADYFGGDALKIL